MNDDSQSGADPFDQIEAAAIEVDKALEGEFVGGSEGSQSSRQSSEPSTADLLSQLLEVTFNGIVAPKRGAHWQMSSAECEALGGAYGAVIDKYLPGFAMGVEATAVVCTLAIIAPRAAMDAKRAKARRQDETQGGDNGKKSEN